MHRTAVEWHLLITLSYHILLHTSWKWQRTEPYMLLQWCHNECDGISNQEGLHCLLNRLFGHRSKETSKLRVTGLCAGNSPGLVNSLHKWPVTQKMFSFDDVIMWKWQWKMGIRPQIKKGKPSSVFCEYLKKKIILERGSTVHVLTVQLLLGSEAKIICIWWLLNSFSAKIVDYRGWSGACYYSDVIMSVMASLINSVSIVYSTVCSGADQRKH